QPPKKPMKPDPSLLFELMHQFKATPETTWMVGDGDADILVARNAGVRSIGVSWGVHSAASLKGLGADVIVESFQELLELFD
ncbi:TPA: hypothetical protein DDW35_06925, partial [Candidatus Sumerlaeota bacterium]|nr:hypothetical protein [Candidatus Sumerlaeota bacterium]